MLKNIRSLYIIKEIFSYIKNGNFKLKLIKYNKKLQKRMNINLLDYRKLSERYIIYEIRGKAKEYNSYNNKLIYEGEYLNGERNGKGKEYDNNGNINIIFEGEYSNNKLWNGLSKEYNSNNKLIFEGEFLKGEIRNGKGFDDNGNIIYQIINGTGSFQEYDYSGKLIYKGEYLNGKRNGKGKEYLDGKLIFEGEFLNGKRWNGKGKNMIIVNYVLKENI